ncbi:uncharacterized protein LOC115538007 [Gadus morhua]|uniref:uncharacterized protein LOC115538007 n=1 Tax=Gadus morhua TaxID=8049 RepID=UPI0011B7EF1A|nr:uncharacterized protein LOC115538007 [Gadus morhua]
MALLDFPVPELDVTLREVGRVLQLTLPPDLYPEFRHTLGQQRGQLEAAQRRLAASATGRENWVTEQFKSRLLECSDPLPTATALPAVLPPRRAGRAGTQLERAAALLWAVAKLHCEPSLVEEATAATERTQQAQIFAACRLPGAQHDEIKMYPDSLHAIVTCIGGVFPVDILSRGSDGSMRPLPVSDIYHQLAQAMSHTASSGQRHAPTICGLSALDRRSWAALRGEMVKQGGLAAGSLGLMESAVVALSLEGCEAPPEMANILNTVRLGGGDGPCLRYYDKVVNVVVFKDSTAGMVFEHSAVDGMVAGLVSECLFHLSETVDINLDHYGPEDHGRSDAQSDGSRVTPTPLPFPLQEIRITPSPSLKATHPVITFEVSSYPDVFSALRSQRGLYDAWINFSLQLSLSQIFGESAANHILVTPTHMRHYKHGRCDPTYSLTMRSRELVGALASCVRHDDAPQYSAHLLQLFHVAFLEHKNLIKATKSGQGVGPHLAALRWSLPSDNPLKKFLDPFGCPSVYLTGKDLMEGVECAVGNVYAKDQLAVTYLGRRDKVLMVLNAKGSFAMVLENLRDSLEINMKLVMLLALRYSIACQMGALDCVLHDSQVGSVNAEVNRSVEGPLSKIKPNSDSMSPDFTLVIHGGAGEVMMLNSKVVEVIEFALKTALGLGSQVLQHGGSSLDAVQRSVEALEDCFLFNAGKGSVFNKDGKNEMEATIVDCSGINSGSVACLQRVRNPIKAARCVMDKSPHSMIVGEGAEDFVHGLEPGEPLGPDYFYTDIRHKELMVKLQADVNPQNNHPQTVGAVALDRWRKLAAATSTGGLVGKLKGRVGDTAVVGAGIYGDDKLAITCSGDGDVFLRHTVAQKVAILYNHKGYTLRQACREVISENLKGISAGIIAVDSKGEAVIETNAGVMFVASMVGGISRVEVLRPMPEISNVIWETDELVAHLNPKPWTPGDTILTRKALSGPSSIFQLALPDFEAMLQAAKNVSNLLCKKLGVQRCALVSNPSPDHPAQIKLLPLHGLETDWHPHVSQQEDFKAFDPGYCSSKSGPRCEDGLLDQVQAKVRDKLPTPNAPSCYDYLGDHSSDDLFSRIVRGEEKQWRVWEDSEHVAFLTPYPNTPGLTVVVPRKPLSSDILSLEDADYTALTRAIYKVAKLLEEGMRARGVALIFEGFEIDYAHAKMIPLVPSPDGSKPEELQPEHFQSYPGYVSSLNGQAAKPEALEKIHSTISQCKPPGSWQEPQTHSMIAIRSQWYHNMFQIQNTLFHSTVEYFHNVCQYSYALTPLTTDTISSPMGLGSDSEPVLVNILGQDVYLADSMQFVLEYFLRFQESLRGTYYISPSFRGEDPDATHLNQFYHVECELLGDMDNAIQIAEAYVFHLTNAMLKNHSDIILNTAGTLTHITDMLSKLHGNQPLPRVPLDQAIPMMPSADCLEWVQQGQPHFGRKLTRKGERVLIEKYGGAVWLTEMDHLGVPFYQAYVEGSGQSKAKASDLLLGLGETVGLGERHSTPELVQEALRHHAVPEESYKWYINMRQVRPLLTSGWGMGTERYLCWLLQHDDIRDIQIIPRMKSKKYMP